jgi:hypothetical protein
VDLESARLVLARFVPHIDLRKRLMKSYDVFLMTSLTVRKRFCSSFADR